MTGREVLSRRSLTRDGRVVGTATRVVPPVVSLGGFGSLGDGGAESSSATDSSDSDDEPRREERTSSRGEYFLVRIATTEIAEPSGFTPEPSIESPVTLALSWMNPALPMRS